MGLVRKKVVREMQKIAQKFDGMESYFHALIMLDKYIGDRRYVDPETLSFVGAAALTVSGYVSESKYRGLIMYLSESEEEGEIERETEAIQRKIREILDLFDYSLHFSTEIDYWRLLVSSNEEADAVFDKLFALSLSSKFRKYTKEAVVRACINSIRGYPIKKYNKLMYSDLGL